MQSYEIPVYKVHLVRDSGILSVERQLLRPEVAADIVGRYLTGVDREHLVVLMVDQKLSIIGLNTVSVGTLDGTIAQPREIFKPAILAGAHGIIIAHNHPSGDPQPSVEDRLLFKRIRDCGKLLQIEMLDAIIIGANGQFYSAKRDTYDL